MVATMDRPTTEEATKTRQLITGGDPDELAPVPTEKAFEDAGEEFLAAPELIPIAEALMAKHATIAAATRKRNIAYCWKRAGGESDGRMTLGKCQKQGPLPKHLAGYDYVIWLAADHARAIGLTCWQREALLFHELMHVRRNQHGKAAIRGHDAAFFAAEVVHYGTWSLDLEHVADAFAQIELSGIGAEE